ncbi:sensor histidine kinase [Hymenobacter edaphi]|uniref:histidine kinase n=1 Tax=Hymenobacter edaphi TaxID=2211146 RepID=A0A328BBH1_9BACT|nr:sensor histidine kinase [Hymenobacter edaphi]RAK62418.1 hypothetical protein DLM85_23740 [Hymenobacter edaphi]
MAKPSGNQVQFKPKASILILLGEELIKSPVMAIYELIKNSYDADAKEVKVDFKFVESPERTQIIIEDNGTGINETVLTNVWFEPGTDFRKPLQKDGTRKAKLSPVFKRVPMGEKGVGRFAVHKLSNLIKLKTRPAEIQVDKDGNLVSIDLMNYELHVEIDWRTFSSQKYLTEVGVSWKKVTDPLSFHFEETSGTYIELSDLKETWTKGMARQLKRSTTSMLSPKNNEQDFRISLNFHNDWLKAIPSINEVLESAPYKLTATLDPQYNLTFEYHFSAQNNSTLGRRDIDKKSKDTLVLKKYKRNIKDELKQSVRDFFAKNKEIAAEEVETHTESLLDESTSFGPLKLDVYSYDLDAQSLRDTMPDPSLIKDLLKEQAGIKVFKGDLRVYDYGEPGNDWLGFDLNRVQNKEWFSNNQVIGFVYLDPAKSGALVEKTNREGFIANKAFDKFVLCLEFIFNEFKVERSVDRRKWLELNRKESPNSFEGNIKSFKQLVESAVIPDAQEKKRILSEANALEKRYQQDKTALLIPAGVGMTASFAIHEIEKLVPRLQTSVRENPLDSIKLKSQVNELNDYVNGILSILRKGGIKNIPLAETIEQAIKNYELRLQMRKVSIGVHIDPDVTEIRCDKRLLITMLMNLIDNSIYWLETVYKTNKGIFISATKSADGVSIVVADNGPGFKDNIEDIVRPFFSRKNGGIGIGMYMIDTAMMQFGKLNIIYDKDELLERNIPPLYDGAAVELLFNKS